MNQVDKEEYVIRALEQEAIEVECLLVEPETDNASVDGVFFCPKENLDRSEMVYLPCEFVGLETNATGSRKDASEVKVLDVLPDKVEVENIQAANGLSTACEDYLLDTGFAESFPYLDYGFNDGLHLANSGLVSQNPGFTVSNIGSFGICSTLTEIDAVPNCPDNTLDNASLNYIFSCKHEPETFDEAKSPNVENLEHGSIQNLMGLSSCKNEKNTASPPDLISAGMSYSSQSSETSETKPVCQSEEIDSGLDWDVSSKNSAKEVNIGTFLKQKRSRKPTRRYIDESSYYTSVHRRKRHEIPHSGRKDKNLGVRCLRNRRSMGSKEKVLLADESFGEAIQVPFGAEAIQVPFGAEAVQVPFDSQALVVVPEPRTALLSQEEMGNSRRGLSSSESEGEAEARVRSYGGSSQRKLHKLWSVAEVRKLIDGVSCCGVGRWTEIKKSLFSSSDHRTAVDLKDKWRNLLKAASCPVKQSKREDERKRNQPWRPIPKSLLCRVRELAMVHPYPREAKSNISKSKLPHVPTLSSPDLPTRKKE